MLDGRSLDVISKFKLALLTRAEHPVSRADLAVSNRGQKLPSGRNTSASLTSKIVQFDGTNYMVLTNDAIERSNYRNKRRWLDFYASGNQNDAISDGDEYSSHEGTSGSDNDNDDENDENPLKKLRLSEILAPLAHPSEVATHAAISKTYKLQCLSNLASDLIHSIEIEQKTLNQFNKLLQVLDGEDWYYQLEENMDLPTYDHGLDDLTSVSDDKTTKTSCDVQDNNNANTINSNNNNNDAAGLNDGAEPSEESTTYKRITRGSAAEEKVKITDPFFGLPKSLALFERQQQKLLEEDDEKDDDPLEILKQDLRNYLQVSIQRQHECIKNLTTIRNGIVKADRYKRDLYKWGKEMSEKK